MFYTDIEIKIQNYLILQSKRFAADCFTPQCALPYTTADSNVCLRIIFYLEFLLSQVVNSR